MFLQAGGAQFQNELCRVDDVGRVRGQREPHLTLRIDGAGQQRHQVCRMERQHQHADHVFPEERGRKKIAAEDITLPDRTR